MPIFQVAEYQQRLSNVKQRMREAGLDVLLASHPANMNYLSGYDGWSYYVHQLVVVALDAPQPVWIGREMDVAGARATVWLSADCIEGYPDHFVDSATQHPMHYVADVLHERGWHTGRIGVEMDAWYFTARAYKELVEKLPRATFADAWPLVNWVRIIKSPAELALMRGAGEIVTRSMQVAIDSIEPGVRENDAVANITHAQLSGTPEFWGDYPATLAAVPSGAKSAAPHLTWSGTPFSNDVASNIELGGCHQRYHAALARTLYLGTPPTKLQHLADVTAEGLEVTLEIIRAGITAEQVEAAWRGVIRKAGYEKKSRIGYSIGLNYPPDWGEQTASLRDGDKTLLEPNMCFHLMLGMWMDDWGFELSETIAVTASGYELLTNFPRKLFVKN
jgi:ectoine hydrolase